MKNCLDVSIASESGPVPGPAAVARFNRFPLQLACLALAALLTLSQLACGSGGGGASGPSQRTQLQDVNVAPSANPLVAIYTMTVPTQGDVVVEFGPTTNYGFSTASQSAPSGGGIVAVLVAGMKQNTLYHMRATFNYPGGQMVDSDRTFQTGAIPPAYAPQLQVTIPPGQTPTPGIQLVSFTGEAFAINTGGDIVWYYQYMDGGGGPYLVKLLPDGHMLMIINLPGTPPSSGIREIDLAGNTVRELDLPTLSQSLAAAGYNLQLNSIDHDVLMMPNGDWVFIVTDHRVFTDLPGYPGQTTVLGSAIIDVDRNNRPVWVWDAFDHLDVNRHPTNFPDWIHANALVYTTADGNLLLSMRHQHWIVKIDYNKGAGAGDILWKLGYQGDFTLLDSTSPSDWFFGQHDANIVSNNTTGDFQLALFDNGLDRVVDDNGDTCFPNGPPLCYSTATIFEVNENDLTAQRGWTKHLAFSFWGGSNQQLADTNMFFDETSPNDINSNTSRVSEVTQTDNPTLVWQMVFNNQTAYRTLHMPSLYPGVQW